MAYKGMKRPASKGAGAARKKKRGTPIAKNCSQIAPSLRSAESLPQPVRKIISDRLVQVFGTYKEDRHPFQNTCSELVGATLKATQANLKGHISEAQAKKAAQEGEGATLGATNDAARAASDSAAQAMDDAKAALNESNAAVKDAKDALHNLETDVKTAEADQSDTTAKKEKLEALITTFFTPVKEGTLDKGLNKSAAYAGKALGKDFGGVLEAEFLVCVVRSFSKPASAWGTFDHIIDKELTEQLKHISAGLVSELAGMEAAKGTRAANVETAKAGVVAAAEHLKVAAEAFNNASVAAKDAKGAAKTAAAAAKQQQSHIDKAASALEDAEKALTKFQGGPLAAYAEVEAHAPPPPEPEPVEEAPSVEAAMAPAPAAPQRPSPSILPSPGILGWAAQAVSSIAPSPRMAPSPRTA